MSGLSCSSRVSAVHNQDQQLSASGSVSVITYFIVICPAEGDVEMRAFGRSRLERACADDSFTTEKGILLHGFKG